MRYFLVLSILLLLTACAPQSTRPIVPRIIRVPVLTYVPIPAALSAPCLIAEPPPLPTVADGLQVARERKASLEGCNADKAQIRGIQGTPVGPHQ